MNFRRFDYRQRIITYLCTALIFATTITPALAGSESDIEGIWAYDPAWCGNSREPAPITITSNEIIGNENACKIVARSQAGDAVKLDLECTGEGTHYSDSTIVITVSEYLIRFYPRDSSVLVFTRCK